MTAIAGGPGMTTGGGGVKTPILTFTSAAAGPVQNRPAQRNKAMANMPVPVWQGLLFLLTVIVDQPTDRTDTGPYGSPP